MAFSTASMSAQSQYPNVVISPTELKSGKSAAAKVPSLAALWAEGYIISVTKRDAAERLRKSADLAEITSQKGRVRIANKTQSKASQRSSVVVDREFAV